MTGRPTAFAEDDCTAPLPLPLEEDSFLGPGAANAETLRMLRRRSSQESRKSDFASAATNRESPHKKLSPSEPLSPAAPPLLNQGSKQTFPPCGALTFTYQTKMNTLNNEVLARLYRAAGMSESWARVQNTISDLDAKIEDWRRELPPEFEFDKIQQSQEFNSQRMALGFLYYSTKIITSRPCLCRVNQRIPDASDKAKAFDQETAAKCVHAARHMLDLLPDEPDAISLYRNAPWWCVTHWLMQAATVTMLELSFRADHMPNEADEIFKGSKKALAWLRDMSEGNESARRAALLCGDLLRQVAPKVGKTVSDAPPSQPTGRSIMADAQNMTSVPHANSNYMMTADGLTPYQSAALSFLNGIAFQPPSAKYQQQYHPQYGHFTTSAPFGPNFLSAYDQMDTYSHSQMPLIPSSSMETPFDDTFTTGMDMDGLTFNNFDSLNGGDGYETSWLPRSHGNGGI